jgi:hypothetical protein
MNMYANVTLLYCLPFRMMKATEIVFPSPPLPRPREEGSRAYVVISVLQQAKVENLQRLYEIDDHPERRAWLDKLLRQPALTSPHIGARGGGQGTVWS